MKANHQLLTTFGILAAFTQFSCGSSGGSGTSGFSSQTALASPFVGTSVSSSIDVTRGFYASERASRVDEIQALLDATDKANCKFAIDLERVGQYASCYGPTLNLTSHPGGGSPSNLPSGDLGLWNSTTTVGGNEACTAGQITKLVNSFGKEAHTANLIGASLYCYLKTSGVALPAVDSSVELGAPALAELGFGTSGTDDTMTVTSARVSGEAHSSGNTLYRYEISGAVEDKESGLSFPFTVVTQHVDTGTNSFKAQVSYAFRHENNSGPGNCPLVSGLRPKTYAGHMIVSKASATSLTQELQTAEFCGSSNPLNTNQQIEASDAYDAATNENGWGDNYNFVLFSFNPDESSSDYLEGDYVYAWQAGKGDSHTRVFNASIAAETSGASGKGYFGYGEAAYAGSTSTAEIGKLLGMICNWAGPGNVHTPVNYVQRQLMTKSSGTWTVSSDDIRYAPTNDCKFNATDEAAFRFNTADSNYSNDYTTAYPTTGPATDGDSVDLFDISSLKSGDFYIPFSSFPTRPTL